MIHWEFQDNQDGEGNDDGHQCPALVSVNVYKKDDARKLANYGIHIRDDGTTTLMYPSGGENDFPSVTAALRAAESDVSV